MGKEIIRIIISIVVLISMGILTAFFMILSTVKWEMRRGGINERNNENNDK